MKKKIITLTITLTLVTIVGLQFHLLSDESVLENNRHVEETEKVLVEASWAV